MFYRPTSRWQWMFIGINLLQVVTALTLEIAIWISLDSSWNFGFGPDFYLWIFALIYKLVLLYDTLANENTFKALGLLLNNVFLCAFGGLDTRYFEIVSGDEYIPLAYSNIGIISFSTLIECFVVWKLYDEYKWNIYKKLDTNVVLLRAYRTLQILMALLKFDFYFYLAHFGATTAISLVFEPLGSYRISPGKAAFLTNVILLPWGVLVVIGTSYPVRRENFVGTIVILLCHLLLIAGIIFDLFWLVHYWQYDGYSIFMASVTGTALCLALATVSVLVWCMTNFGHGLKPYLTASRRAMELELQNEKDPGSSQLHSTINAPCDDTQGYRRLSIRDTPSFESTVLHRVAAIRPV